MEETAIQRLGEAEKLLQEGDVDQAIRVIQSVIRESPGGFKAHLLLADAYARKGGSEGFVKMAEREFDAAWKAVPPVREAHEAVLKVAARIGRLEFLAGEYSGALRDLPFAGELGGRARDMKEDAGREKSPARPVGGPSPGLSANQLLWGILLVALASGLWWILSGRHASSPASAPSCSSPANPGNQGGPGGSGSMGDDVRAELARIQEAIGRLIPRVGMGIIVDRTGENAREGRRGRAYGIEINSNGIHAMLAAIEDRQAFDSLSAEMNAAFEQNKEGIVAYGLGFPLVLVVETDTPDAEFTAAAEKAWPEGRIRRAR